MISAEYLCNWSIVVEFVVAKPGDILSPYTARHRAYSRGRTCPLQQSSAALHERISFQTCICKMRSFINNLGDRMLKE